ncbi:MAG: hypothetical protein ABIH70_03090 [Chloroflexota bacterium]
MKKIILFGLLPLSAIILAALVACTSSAVPSGSAGPQEVAYVSKAGEVCAACHGQAGAAHQASYDELYQDDVIKVTNLNYSFSAPDSHKVAFKMTKDGVPIDAQEIQNLAIYFVPYTGTSFQFEPAGERLSLKGDLSYDGAGVTTSTLVNGGYSDLSKVNGLVVVYGRDESVGTLPARINQSKYLYAALIETGTGVDYVSAANNDGCVKCHTDPYAKHGYILAQVNNDATTDFYTCKACHLDNGEGGHFEWQLLVDDPEKAVEWLNSEEDLSIFTPEQLDQLAYTTSLMNDVHMSHAMEFPYPQSMANCITCHEGKLDKVLSAENFNIKTCKSCHAVNGDEEHGTTELALSTIIPSGIHGSMDLDTVNCASCHAFSTIHSGYDEIIYTADGQRYSDAITVTINKASLSGNELTITLSASGTAGSVDSANIVPEVMVSLYGYDTKDFIVNGHDRYDSSGNGVISRADGDLPKGAYEVGTEHAYFKTVSQAAGAWTVTHDLTEWSGMIADGTIKRVEIAVLSILDNADGEEVAINAVSRTFNLGTNKFDDAFYSPIVKVEDGCNNCHDALATTFHTPDYGGKVVVCRMCHVGLVGGSHLEMQSRSIDSYIHAIHSSQAFDIGDIDFADPVEAMHYEHHINFPYPTPGVTNCESCHNPGTYNVPDQSKSLPGILSAADKVTTMDRNIGAVPSYVTGPAARACGACHRARLINEDDAEGLSEFFQHIEFGGYLIENGAGVIDTVIETIMASFK